MSTFTNPYCITCIITVIYFVLIVKDSSELELTSIPPKQPQETYYVNLCDGNNTTEINFQAATGENQILIPKNLILKPFVKRFEKLYFNTVRKKLDCESNLNLIEEEILLVSTSSEIKDQMLQSNSSIKGNKTISPALKFAPDGRIKYKNDIYSTNEYCILRLNQTSLRLLICNANCNSTIGSSRPCLQKCCGIGKAYDLSGGRNGICSSSPKPRWTPIVYSDPYNKMKSPHTVEFHFQHFQSWSSWCNGNRTPVLTPLVDLHFQKRIPFRILKDGSVVYKTGKRTWTTLTKGTYCIDGAINFPNNTVREFQTDEDNIWDEKHTIIIDCSEAIDNNLSDFRFGYGISMMCSAICVLFTIIVYIILWNQQNIHGWTFLGNFIFLFLTYTVFAAAYIALPYLGRGEPDSHKSTSQAACYTIAVAGHFFFVGMFSWMTAVNFDFWLTFRQIKPMEGKSNRIQLFLVYCIFSLGIPTIVIGIALTLERIYGDDVESDVIVPEYGVKTCTLEVNYASLMYIYIPNGILWISNVIFFVYSFYIIHRERVTNESITKNRTMNEPVLFLKLFLVMGIPWGTEIITWATLEKDGSLPWFSIILEFINIFQGIAIFVIFVCKRDIKKSLIKRNEVFKRFFSFMDKVNNSFMTCNFVSKWRRRFSPTTNFSSDRIQESITSYNSTSANTTVTNV